MEGDNIHDNRKMVNRDFYPRPHMEGDRKGGRHADPLGDFYPRPHMEGDGLIPVDAQTAGEISTHALTWRATVNEDGSKGAH